MSQLPVPVHNGLPAPLYADVRKLFERLEELIEAVKEANGDVKRLSEQGFLGRFVSNVSGETGRAFANAQDLQGQLQEAQIALGILNLQLLGQLKTQQDTIDEQQRALAEANDRLEAQQSEIQTTTGRVEKQQETILSLLNLTKEQEAEIREVVQQAAYVRDLEKRHDARLAELADELSTARTEVGEWVQRRLVEETTELQTAIEKAAAAESSARSEVAARLQTVLTTEREQRTQSLVSNRSDMLDALTKARTDLADADATLRGDIQTLTGDHRALREAHGELTAQHGGLATSHGSAAQFGRRVAVATGLALLLSIVALVLALI